MTGNNRQETGREQTVPQLFAAQVRRQPHAVAVSCAGTDVSYAELDARSDLVAARLTARGVGADDVVAVRIDRGPGLIAALLGVLKAGAAYLGLETGAPPARQEQLVAVARAVAVLTEDDVSGGPPPDRGAPPRRAPHPDGLAYLSFTSGSTGEPKAVGVPHRAVARLVTGGFAETGPQHSFLHLSPVAFDASTFEIWCCLLTGGRLVVQPPGPVAADELAAVIRDGGVTTAWLTAGLFHQLVEHHLEALGGLRQLLAGGDVLNPAHVNRFVERFPGVPLINGYGPTENTTFTACHTVREPVPGGAVPIGRPIRGTEVRVLDERLDAAPTGERGELYAAGAGLSRGYLGSPVATALRFLPDPYAAVPGARMYRTGDMVRQNPRGDLEFLGRIDRQVKIRGYRVDPAEVERVLNEQPGVAQAVVLVRRDGADGNSMVGYLVADPGAQQDAERLAAGVRRALREVLPAPMIPASFVALDAFPLKPNGKVDAAALPVPSRTARQADIEYLAPRTHTEQLLADLWAEALGADRVGVWDDFFELGGNSLLATGLMLRTEVVFGVELQIRTLFENPSVAELAAEVDRLASVVAVGR